MKKEDRERIEWTNSWWAQANRESKRCLLIGDSTTRQIRGSMEKLLMNMYAVDLFAASFSILDNRLIDNLKVFFKRNEYLYDVVIVHYGGHHGFSKSCSIDKKVYKEYYQKYTKLIKYLHRRCKQIIVVTGTSKVMENDLSVVDIEKEQEIAIRNEIVLKVGKKQKCNAFDLYSFSKEYSSVLKYMDKCHFVRETDYFIAYTMLKFMLEKQVLEHKLIKNQCYNNKKVLEEITQKSKIFYIYGAGMGAQELFWFLKWNGLEENIKYFIVTHKSEQKDIWNIPILTFEQISEKEKKEGLLIISSKKYADEMYTFATENNFNKIIFGDELLNAIL